MNRLKSSDLFGLGFMTFALFLGAGNIIFPPSAGMAAGEYVWAASLGFLITGVGLPLLTVVALGRVGGGMDELTAPIGRVAGVALAVAVYLAIGPLFATPRTATVSFEMGIAPLVGNTPTNLALYSVAYFAVVLFLSLKPGKLLDSVGKLITPLLLAALLVLGGAAFLVPAGPVGQVSEAYQAEPLVKGFLEGYLTMDALGALVFGIVIADAIKSRGITAPNLITRYSVYAGIIAAIGLGLVYISLFYLGATSQSIAGEAANGVQVLTAYVEHTFGYYGLLLLAVVITLACVTTATGLISACGAYFHQLTGISYRVIVVVFVLFSLFVSNLGLSQIIQISIPVLVGLYPLAIVLVALSLMNKLWLSQRRVFIPTMAVTLMFGLADGVNQAGFQSLVPEVFSQLPFAAMGLSWLVPVLVTLALVVVYDRLRGKTA